MALAPLGSSQGLHAPAVKRHRGEPEPGTHTRDTGKHKRTRGHTDHTDEPHNHPNPTSHPHDHATAEAAADSEEAAPSEPDPDLYRYTEIGGFEKLVERGLGG